METGYWIGLAVIVAAVLVVVYFVEHTWAGRRRGFVRVVLAGAFGALSARAFNGHPWAWVAAGVVLVVMVYLYWWGGAGRRKAGTSREQGSHLT